MYLSPTSKLGYLSFKSDRNRKHISGAKMRFTKNYNLMITSVFEHNYTLRVARCSRIYILFAYNGTGGVSLIG